jgi:isochorismate synthase
MLLPRPVLAELELRLGVPARGLRLVEVAVDIDPLDLVRSGAAAFGFAGFFASPEGREIGAIGAIRRFVAEGPHRLTALDRGLAAVSGDLPLLVGFGFGNETPGTGVWSGFPAAVAVLPAVMVVRTAGRGRLVVAVPPGSDGAAIVTLLAGLDAPGAVSPGGETEEEVEAAPPAADYVDAVDRAIAAIHTGRLSKVVLARSVLVRRGLPFDAFGVVSRLRADHPVSWVFGWQEGEATFVGASPELLVARREDHVHLSPLAGSAPRSADPEQDRRLGESLLASAKDRAEHEMVVVDAVERLGPLVSGLYRSPTPQLHRFPTVQHLATPISGTTRARLLELAEALHPTAAVGGLPREVAPGVIADFEQIERGWYAGGIGWTDAAGNGEVAVALRCALLRGEAAIAYAGCGIVADSVPAAELEETRLKLRPVLDALG